MGPFFSSGVHRFFLGLTVALAIALATAVASASVQDFAEGIEDLPLMPGLQSHEGGLTVFDSPYGTIVESTAKGRVLPADVLDFYARTLPQLGWTRTGETLFRREAEELVLDVGQNKTDVIVRFRVMPVD
ncbi:hypothetical protein HEQ60_09970 [Haematospirillum sp. H1815]|uniref:hypothetical protein n=1 Tax=Haematospirillum sp. H1815 TaxID=2723108 RepID=UPI00143BC522|nr:hypothetical protein [Haematospirillum sp. H1815]NKD78084.1 hypothetical protein [Haematospirillum sp. H1815]